MQQRGLGVRELADRLGVWPQALMNLLEGLEPSFDIAVVLADFFDESPELILKTGGVLGPVPEEEYFRQLLLKETSDMSSEELYDLIAYIMMLKRVKAVDHHQEKRKAGRPEKSG